MRMPEILYTEWIAFTFRKKRPALYGPVQHISAIAKWIRLALQSAHLHPEAQDEMTPAADHPASPGRSAGVD
jgi:hypothetical protein